MSASVVEVCSSIHVEVAIDLGLVSWVFLIFFIAFLSGLSGKEDPCRILVSHLIHIWCLTGLPFSAPGSQLPLSLLIVQEACNAVGPA